jgi:hypothetical protein
MDTRANTDQAVRLTAFGAGGRARRSVTTSLSRKIGSAKPIGLFAVRLQHIAAQPAP